MSCALIIGTARKENHEMNISSLESNLRRMFPTIQINIIADVKQRYFLEWIVYQNGTCVTEGKLAKDFCTFVIEYFNLPDRNIELAKYIVFLRSYFPIDSEVVICDEAYTFVIPLEYNTTPDDLSKNITNKW